MLTKFSLIKNDLTIDRFFDRFNAKKINELGTKRRITKCRHSFVETNNVELRNVKFTFSEEFVQNVETTPASRPGVVWCSLL